MQVKLFASKRVLNLLVYSSAESGIVCHKNINFSQKTYSDENL